MVKVPKNAVSLILISSSIALLLALQVVWLRKEYTDQRMAFHRDTHNLLRNVLFELTDSLILKGMKPVAWQAHAGEDSIFSGGFKLERRTTDTTRTVQIFVSSTVSPDTLPDVIRPLVSRVRAEEGVRKFILRLPSDSLSLAEVQGRFGNDLAQQGIHLSYTITRTNAPFHPMEPGPAEQVMTPSGRYEIAFAGLPNFLLMKILPQILFSVFLTCLTIASFVLMYRSLRMQQRLVEIKNGFIGNITHELKTPITTVGVALEALRNFKGLQDPHRTEEYLAIAESELKRLSLLTDKVLNSALFESSEAHFNFESVDLSKTLEHVLQSMKLVIEKSGASIDLQRDGQDFVVAGDRDHLQNVFFNLLDNSLKYGRNPIKIVLTLSGQPERVRIAVGDNGIGIPKEHQDRIFEKFFRVPTGDVHNSKGHGLGLSYVHSVVAGHNGTIEVTSEVGQGSSFIVTLPRQHES